jgi:hypothetical protein
MECPTFIIGDRHHAHYFALIFLLICHDFTLDLHMREYPQQYVINGCVHTKAVMWISYPLTSHDALTQQSGPMVTPRSLEDRLTLQHEMYSL